jgi:hypothetical protein
VAARRPSATPNPGGWPVLRNVLPALFAAGTLAQSKSGRRESGEFSKLSQFQQNKHTIKGPLATQACGL